MAIAGLAARQHGVVSRRQLIAAGVSRSSIEHRLTVRRLHPIYAGVYAVGHPLMSGNGRYMAAVLAYRPPAVLSHTSAAAHIGIRPSSSPRIELTVSRRALPRPGIRVHQTRSLHPGDVTTHDGIKCTTVARTIVDLAGTLSRHDLRRVIERAEQLALFDGSALTGVLARSAGRRGVRMLRALLTELPAAPAPLRSELERRFLELVRRAGLPMPAVNAWIAGYEVDFHWPQQRLIVETDGRGTHGTVLAFERDRRRDLDLELAGWRVLRLSWHQVTREPARVVAALRRRLAVTLPRA